MSITLTYIEGHPNVRRAEGEIAETGAGGVPAPGRASDDLIELLFFAYRDFVGDPDRILAEYGFGRAHHRVLHFVDRYPGLTIAELLDILRITKQSLNRVLKDLIEQGYIEQTKALIRGGKEPGEGHSAKSPSRRRVQAPGVPGPEWGARPGSAPTEGGE